MTSLLLNGEVKEDAVKELPRQQEPLYASSSDNYVKMDASTGRQYYDLNAANRSYRGAWLFGSEHIQVYVGPLKAQWDQWCPIPADIPDGVLIKGGVVYQQPNGSWNPSADEFEGVLRTMGGVRYFIGKTQHTFTGRNVPNGMMKVVANMNVKLTGSASSNPLVPIRRQSSQYTAGGGGGGPATYSPYARSESGAYGSPPAAQEPSYSQSQGYGQQSTPQTYQPSQSRFQQPAYQQSYPQQSAQPTYQAPANPDFLNPSGSHPSGNYGQAGGGFGGQPGGGYAPAVRQPSNPGDPDPAGF